MIKKILTTVLLCVLFLTSCKEMPKQQNAETITETAEKNSDDLATIISTNNDGKELAISFNNTKRTASLNFEGSVIELIQQKSASGIWYKNDTYELRGKGNNIELKKGDTVVFTHIDDIVKTSIKNQKRQTLDIIYNNTTNQAQVFLDGGEQIALIGQKPASGIWYKNDQYELRGKGENIELTKDRKSVFKK